MNETGWKGDQRWSARLYTPSFPPFFPDFLSLQRERGAIIILISILISRKEKKKKKKGERRRRSSVRINGGPWGYGDCNNIDQEGRNP